MPESKFTPAQAEELATAFAEHGVDYLFIGERLEQFKAEYLRQRHN